MRPLLFVIQLLFSCFVFSQENNINYVVDFITTEQGLSHNYVTSIVSDDLNIKWIGTENGITKFNGYDFEYIKPGSVYNELLNENIEVLFKDADSNIWIGTKSGGLSILDVKNNLVKTYNSLIDLRNEGDLRITALAQDVNGNIWVGTWSNGVFVIDYKNKKLLKQYNSNQAIYSIIKDFNNNMWFCVGNKLHFYNTLKDNMQVFSVKGQLTDILSDASRNKVWMASSSDTTEIYSFNYDTETIEVLETGVTSNFSKKLCLDAYNRIWIGTWGKGVYRSNEDLTTFSKIELVADSPEKISDNYNTILAIHQDKNNVTWLATANGGVVKLLEGNGFNNADKLINNEELKEHLNFTCLHKNKDNIFLGTLFSGLYYGKDFSNLKQIKGIGNQKVNVLYEHEEKLYIGTQFGFYIYDLKLEIIIQHSKTLGKITAFLIENDTMYIGTQQLGIAIVNMVDINNPNAYVLYSENRKSNKKIESNRITDIQKDTAGNVWISTYNGLHLFEKSKKRFIHQSSLLEEKLPSVIINDLEINGQFIWLATPSGLIKLHYSNSKLTIENIITEEDGLNSDFICALTFDNKHNLWLTTHTEIVKYNDANTSIISYGDINGVRSTSFNNRSYYNYNSETIYFGGIDNITFFNPSEIKNFNTVPEIIFTGLRVNNELIEYNTNNTILDKSFNYVDKIKLTHQDNFFSTRFVANDFLGTLNIKYRYLLEGYHDEWINLLNRNEINFAGLTPNTYTLKVQGSRDGRNWSVPKSIDIILLGSPWKSPLALIIYSLVVLAIIAYLMRSNTYKLKLKNSLEIARIDKEKEMELSEAKLNFFTNISHEFRTPLTLIITPLQELLETTNLPQKVSKNLSIIDKNSNRLLNLINQLLDFRKADNGLLTLSVSYGNFIRFSNEVFLYFKQLAKSKNIKYKFKAEEESIFFPFDRNKMEIVLCNLLSNAIKYSNPGGKITMTLSEASGFCVISIKDTGIGMDEEDLDKIFDRFFQIKSAETARMIGSGIGLAFSKKIIELHHGTIAVTSKKSKGTEFVIKLSLDPSLYKGEINESFLNTDNIKAYDTLSTPQVKENLNLKQKEHSVLIIDDNLEILEYLTDILQETYSITKADNGNTGFEIASTEIPDLIISDVMMPGKDGITLCKELKSQITTSHIPIILLTARSSSVFEIQGLQTGANDYITKPFNATVVKARIASLLENREKLRAHLLNKVRFEPSAQTSTEKNIDPENLFINKAILLVEDNLHNPSFGIDNMVDELNMSQSTLFRKIKSLTGLSLTAFIRSIRLKKAAQIIITSNDLNLNEIAYEVGFNDYKYFKDSFKKQFNCLPSKYREKAKNSKL
ncbi:two component regulator with propeller domain [Jejuia pallidilutea]|uniref:histidine kinase n=1 Tax=Jejuia pallidilutea TaxID=504487 RepID=A0A362X3B3_9FLAO|nr:ATP-binding protein [Jejuia pallidilutea]PQV48393.1 two component regulator with propeller domain [Jejuia pallidilutea]